jgi:hypothetical protein
VLGLENPLDILAVPIPLKLFGDALHTGDDHSANRFDLIYRTVVPPGTIGNCVDELGSWAEADFN